MSALIILTVGIVVAVPHVLTLQFKSNFNDAINWLNNPGMDKYLNNNSKTQKYNNYEKRLQNFLKKTAKLLEHTDKKILNYNNEIKSSSENNQRFDIQNDALEENSLEVLNQYLPVKASWLKSVPMKRKPNYPLKRGNGVNNLYQNADNNDLTDYSKIYLVLNPDSNLEKADVKDISNLVSSMLLKFNINNKPTSADRLERPRYKGFLLRDNRRRIRESNEKFIPKDSMEHEHKPKRARNEYTGARGRTGVPYVRHRGDVYERE